MRTIAVVTGARSDYYMLRPVMRGIKAHAQLRLVPVALGMHMSPHHGGTIEEVRRDFPETHTLAYRATETPWDMARTVGLYVRDLADMFYDIRPDVVLVLGDRAEIFAAAQAAAISGVGLAHIHGGEVSGCIDDKMRNAITMLADWHFAATEKACERLVRIRNPLRKGDIFLTGSPAVDAALSVPEAPRAGGDYIVVLVHPSGEPTLLNEVSKAVKDMRAVWIGPNNDPGNKDIRLHSRRSNVPHDVFINLLRQCRCLVGNSSCAFIEGSALGVKAVNVGHRQDGRENAGNVVHAEIDAADIRRAMALPVTEPYIHTLYGDGHATENIVKVLAEEKL